MPMIVQLQQSSVVCCEIAESSQIALAIFFFSSVICHKFMQMQDSSPAGSHFNSRGAFHSLDSSNDADVGSKNRPTEHFGCLKHDALGHGPFIQSQINF